MAEQSKNAVATIKEFLAKLELASVKSQVKSADALADNALAGMTKNFTAALDDDFNTPQALAAVFELINALHKRVWAISRKDAAALQKTILNNLGSLGFQLKRDKVPAKILSLVKKREALRAKNEYGLADDFRKQIEVVGYKVEDTPLGPLVLSK